jgi:oligoendopeptidase F
VGIGGFFHCRVALIFCLALGAFMPDWKLSSGAAAAPARETTGIAMWDLTDLYQSPEAWAAEYDRVKDEAQHLNSYRETLGSSAEEMRRALDAIAAVNKEASRLYTYASLKADEDVTDARNQERKQQAGALNTLIGERTAWVAPEVLSLGSTIVQRFIAADKELAARHD